MLTLRLMHYRYPSITLRHDRNGRARTLPAANPIVKDRKTESVLPNSDPAILAALNAYSKISIRYLHDDPETSVIQNTEFDKKFEEGNFEAAAHIARNAVPQSLARSKVKLNPANYKADLQARPELINILFGSLGDFEKALKAS